MVLPENLKQVSAYVDISIAERLNRIASALGQSRGKLIENMIEAEINYFEEMAMTLRKNIDNRAKARPIGLSTEKTHDE